MYHFTYSILYQYNLSRGVNIKNKINTFFLYYIMNSYSDNKKKIRLDCQIYVMNISYLIFVFNTVRRVLSR